MTKHALKFIKDKLETAKINYEFGSWTTDIKYPYFTGEYTESPAEREDGYQEADFILNGFHRGTWLELEEAREAIEDTFNYTTTILDDGSGVDVSYNGALIVPDTDETLKRLQINLKIKIWKV